MVLTDAQWMVLEPLIQACRPPHKTEHHDLRRTIEAIIWRCQNGAKRRSVPAELGPWWKAAQTFIRWARLGVWERLLVLAQGKGAELGMAFLDGTNIPAANASRFGERTRKRRERPKRGRCPVNLSVRRSAARRARGQALSLRETPTWAISWRLWHLAETRSVCGWACVIADAAGRAVAFVLAPGQAHELPMAPGLVACLPDAAGWIAAGKGYASHAFRDLVWDSGARPAIPPKSNEEPVACPSWIYANRNRVERFWARLKEWRAVATRYEKTVASFMGVLCFAAAMDWIKN